MYGQMDKQMHKGRKDGRKEDMSKHTLQFCTTVLHLADKYTAAS